MQCPDNSFRYNTSLCGCNPGYIFNGSSRNCQLFSEWGPVEMRSGVDYSLNLPETIFNFDSIKKFTQSQAVFLEATFALLLSWLLFCLFVRLVGPLGDGRSPWFRIRWWISRLDVCFATRHWLDDEKVVKKRKTELGGTFSIASCILFIGLFAALLYQILSKRSVEVHNIIATNAPDLASFLNDMEFNITTISSMSCSNLRGLGTLDAGDPGSIGYKVAPLSSFANSSCLNTTIGPTITLKCNNCQLIRDGVYISWQFVDLPNNPATAVGFQFNLTAKSHGDKKHLSSVSGAVNGSIYQSKAITFRGKEPNILKFNLFPRLYRNMHDLKLIQPLFHDFLLGSSFSDINQLQASLERSSDGQINTTLYVNFLSDYIVEIGNENIMGPVSFLADLGGLYCFSIGIFFYTLVQCEYRMKKLRNEDSVMRGIRNRRKAQERWNKLRKYVMYTWGPSSLDDNHTNVRNEACCSGIGIESLHKSSSSHKLRQRKDLEMLSFSRNVNLPSEKKAVPETNYSQVSKFSTKPASNSEESFAHSHNEPEHVDFKNVKNGAHDSTVCSHLGEVSQTKAFSIPEDLTLPPLPVLQSQGAGEISISDLQKSLENLYDYNVILREKLVAAQSILHALSEKKSSPSLRNQS
ncbi:hypothetical protein ACH5RR_016173 [Cinchona calisaya]|uniref:Uncharacterized protein n=1 Tax=Cinchona calisaya TaxID=153742 RepID=A0ABD2ZW54_9GENT